MKKAIVAAAGLVAAFTLTGCIAQSGFHWSDPQPKKGDTTKGTFDLYGIENTMRARGTDQQKAYFYIQIAGSGSGVNFKNFEFDPGKVLGKPVEMVQDDTLSEFADSECSAPTQAVTYRTQKPVPASPQNKILAATMKAKIANEGGGFAGFFITGQWYDDGDKTPEDESSSDDVYECSGQSTTFMGSKTQAPATAQQAQSALDK